MHLGDEVGVWAQVFADYEILQPFPQLGRPVFRLEQAERSSTTLDRFKGIEVPVGRLLGLTKRGWEREAPQDAGIEHEITRPLPDGGTIEVTLAPGIEIGTPQYSADQTLRAVDLCSSSARTFGDLDPITASEVLAELTSLKD
ncbi:MAG: DUF4132 domain-containing protein [Umezawaea sp.]